MAPGHFLQGSGDRSLFYFIVYNRQMVCLHWLFCSSIKKMDSQIYVRIAAHELCTDLIYNGSLGIYAQIVVMVETFTSF